MRNGTPSGHIGLMPLKERSSTPVEKKSTDGSKPRGARLIAGICKTLPNAPGVYRMMDERETVLYVGKARSLKKRVLSYSRLSGHSNRIARMIVATARMEFITTRTEAEALLLEANLIKQLKPRYNVLLRDDKSFPYILLTRDHEAPQVVKHRGARKRKGDYFGPFASAGAVNRTIDTLQRAFLLRSCTDSVYRSRSRPCLLYQIKRCSAPCTGEISIEDYRGLTEEAERFLTGRSGDMRKELQAKMEAASETLDYEMAAQYRNRLTAMAHVQSHQDINTSLIGEADIFAAHMQGGQCCIQVFFFRAGQNWGNRAYFPRADKSLPPEEILDAFIAQFYNNKPVPKDIMLSHVVPSQALLEEALGQRSGRRVHISVPKRGQKKDIVAQAIQNAREALGRRLAEKASQLQLLEGLAERFDLPRMPRRIEVYDNSHIQGSHAVGAMIVAGPDGLMKNQYRKFNIKDGNLEPGDDVGMMREVIHRRFARLMKEQALSAGGPSPGGPSPGGPSPKTLGTETSNVETQNEAETLGVEVDDLSPWPDLILVDGGRGQLSAALQALNELEITRVTVVGVAKGPDRDAGREHFHMPSRRPFMMKPHDSVLYFVQRLRDEAHRFAIGSHRAKRKRAMHENPLDEIQGVGPARKRALLQHFGSAKAAGRAGVADLAAVEGISTQLAQKIYDHFHE